MTITIELPDDVEAALRSDAEARQKPLSDVAALAIRGFYSSRSSDEYAATVQAIREGIADGEAGREQPFEAFVAEMQAIRFERRAGRSNRL